MKSLTFIMLKPDAIKNGLVYKILEYFTTAGFQIKTLDLYPAVYDKVNAHYAEVFSKYGQDFKDNMMKYFENNYVMPILIEGVDAVKRVRKIVGATNPAEADRGTIRGDLSCDSYEQCKAENRALRNLIHASDSPESVISEAKIWLPDFII